MNSLEACERSQFTVCIGRSCRRCIYLNHFVAVARSGVFHLRHDLNGVTRGDAGLQIRILKGRVTQSMTERIQGCSLKVSIGLSGDVIICEWRKVIGGFIKRYGQSSRWIVISEENVGYSDTGSLS